ncbi:hypothetical protein JTE90_006734 [Oedothorax gibbosus]|uniref:Uncharacterized protein n=1 Tax=Oedothorax gibbosus TaxID=931172 RepID=A0AAV6UA19_9ARAC|nr:hypothetical protein JTE90_006734 [Oedothorax gibbosus]
MPEPESNIYNKNFTRTIILAIHEISPDVCISRQNTPILELQAYHFYTSTPHPSTSSPPLNPLHICNSISGTASEIQDLTENTSINNRITKSS